MSLLPKSIHRCRRYPTKFNNGRDIPAHEVLLVIGDSLSIDTSACAAPQPTKRSIQRFVIHVMQQRSEPSLPVSLRCFVHPREIWR
jgi:hypothetical protein